MCIRDRERPVGYSQDGLVNIYLDNNSIHEHFDAIFDELTQTGAVVSMTEAGSPTTAVWGTTSGISWKGKDPNLSTDFGFVNVSFDYGKTINWTISEGRDFSKAVSYTHLRAHETVLDLVCRLLLEKKKIHRDENNF